jgi:hypothetical protein
MNWYNRVYGCVFDLWRKQLLSENSVDIVDSINQLRIDQPTEEKKFFIDNPNLSVVIKKQLALELIALYHIAKAVEIAATNGINDNAINTHFESALKATLHFGNYKMTSEIMELMNSITTKRHK